MFCSLLADVLLLIFSLVDGVFPALADRLIVAFETFNTVIGCDPLV